MQGNLSGDGPYQEQKFVAASPRSGGARIELIKHKKTKKSAEKPSKVDRKRNENNKLRSRMDAAQPEAIKAAPDLLCQIEILDQRILDLTKERKKGWISLRKRMATTELLHRLREKRQRLATQL